MWFGEVCDLLFNMWLLIGEIGVCVGFCLMSVFMCFFMCEFGVVLSCFCDGYGDWWC